MPTGYTAGILDGEIKTFPEFAKLCMRNFGATIHMRDDSLNTPYIKRTPSDYHTKKIAEAKQLLDDAHSMSDEILIAKRKAELEKSKAYHLEQIEKSKVDTKAMTDILKDVRNWNPPTEDHKGIKSFMIEQIEKTIDFDCDTKYHDEALSKIELELLSLNAKTIREDMIASAKKDFAYHTKEYNEDVQRCEKSNKWVTDLLDSL